MGMGAGAGAGRRGRGQGQGQGEVQGQGRFCTLCWVSGSRGRDADSSMDYSEWSNVSGTVDGSAMGRADSRVSRGVGGGGVTGPQYSGTPGVAQRPLPLGSPLTPAVAPIILASASPDFREGPTSQGPYSRSSMQSSLSTSPEFGAAVIPVSQSPEGLTPHFAGETSLENSGYIRGTPTLAGAAGGALQAPGSGNGSGGQPMITPEASKPFQQVSEGSLRKVREGAQRGHAVLGGAGIPEEDPSPGASEEGAGEWGDAGTAEEEGEKEKRGSMSVGGVLGGVASQMLRCRAYALRGRGGAGCARPGRLPEGQGEPAGPSIHLLARGEGLPTCSTPSPHPSGRRTTRHSEAPGGG